MTIKIDPATPLAERTHKRCPRCQTVKPRAAFTPRPDRADGMHSHCKDCNTESARRYRATPAGRDASRVAAREYARRLKARATAASPESPGN